MVDVQPLVKPMASTIVKASTHSTAEATKTAVTKPTVLGSNVNIMTSICAYRSDTFLIYDPSPQP
jgi:hypothetical protein